MVKESFDPGLTQQFTGQLRRAINKDGSFNVHRKGAGFKSLSPYLFLVDTSWPRFMAVLLLGYLVVNLLFAVVFYAIGPDSLAGDIKNIGVGRFARAFYFSVHTLTTVGYGSLYPRGYSANTVAAIEAMVGLMGFALATGLLYARFSRPSARIVFSQRMIVSPYREITSLQFRIANERENVVIDLEAKVLLMTVERRDGQLQRRYVDLPLERPKVLFFPLTWTVVHPIDVESPLFGKGPSDLAALETEFLILVKGFDNTFSQTVNVRYSYRHDEIAWGAKFQPAFYADNSGDLVLELDRINEMKRVELKQLALEATEGS
jgi:inward rectifier potassium channel